MHHAIQMIWPLSDSLCKLNGRKITGVTVIDSKVDHQLEMVEGWVLLIEPKSNLGRELVTKLMGQPFKSFRTPFSESGNKPCQTDDFIEFLTPIFDELKLTKQFLVANKF